jgi:HEAT repeat protein
MSPVRSASTLCALLLLPPLAAQDGFNGRTAGQWLEQMRHGESAHDRDYAQWALGEMTERAHRVVIEALDDPDLDVRVRALRLVIQFGPSIARAADRVRTLAGDADPRVQPFAAAALLRLTTTKAGVAMLGERLRAHDRPVCIAAAMALRDLGADAASAVPALAAALAEHGEFYESVAVTKLEHAETLSEGVHLEIVRTLGALGDAAAPAVPALEQALAHPSPFVRNAAIDALGGIGAAAAPAVPALIAQLDSPEWGDRRDVVHALSRIAAAAPHTQRVVVEALIGRLADDSVFVRGAACIGLARIGSGAKAATPALMELLASANERDGHASKEAIEALQAIGPGARDAVPMLEQLIAGNPQFGPAAARAVATIAPEEGKKIPAVAEIVEQDEAAKLPEAQRRELGLRNDLDALAGKDDNAKMHAVLHIGETFAREAAPTLVKMLDETHEPKLRTALVGVLGDLGARAAAAKIRPLLDDPAVAEVAMFTLARFVDAPSLPRLLKTLADPAAPERTMLGMVLGSNGVEAAAPHLLEMIGGDGAQHDDNLLVLYGALMLRDPRFTVVLRKHYDALAARKDLDAEAKLAKGGELLLRLAQLDPRSQRDLLAAHLDDEGPADRRVALAEGLARVQEPRAFAVLLAAGKLAPLNWYLAPELLAKLDGLWLEADEWEHVPRRTVAKTIAERLGVAVEFAPAVTPAQQRDAFDLGEAYEFLPRGLRLRALLWLEYLAERPFLAADAKLAWLATDGRVRIVPAAEAQAFWQAEAARRSKAAADRGAGGR